MGSILNAVITVAVIGFICAVVLAVASKIMAVKVDERAVRLRAALPGVNCGACGYTGCDGYASALLGEGVKTNLCTPGGGAAARELSSILGVGFAEVVEQVAVVHCRGDDAARHRKMSYDGIMSCKAAKLLHGGQNACVFGCLGFGDCADSCPNGAICIEGGLARIDTRKCSGCGLCAKCCPNGIIFTESDAITTVVMCKNTEKGAATRRKCSCGCIGCKMCAKECPVDAIVIESNLARVDYDKCIGCGKCVKVCPVGSICQADFRGLFKSADLGNV